MILNLWFSDSVMLYDVVYMFNEYASSLWDHLHTTLAYISINYRTLISLREIISEEC